MSVIRFVKHPTVPDGWKHPFGPYRQAPAEFGGEWWFVNPFVTATPWILAGAQVEDPKGPKEFEELFGAYPKAIQFGNDSNSWRAAKDQWKEDLSYFVRAGNPEWVSDELVELTSNVYEAWGMGKPKSYEGRYGWMTRFPDSKFRFFEFPTHTAMNYPHLVVSQYQIKVVQELGEIPLQIHPFVPQHLLFESEE